MEDVLVVQPFAGRCSCCSVVVLLDVTIFALRSGAPIICIYRKMAKGSNSKVCIYRKMAKGSNSKVRSNRFIIAHCIKKLFITRKVLSIFF
jgi:hypothetical protein